MTTIKIADNKYTLKSKILQSGHIGHLLTRLEETSLLYDTLSIEETDELCTVFDSIYNKELIEYFPEEMEDDHCWFNYKPHMKRVSCSISIPLRHIYIDKAGFSIITKPLADKLSMFLKGKKCLEIMAGKAVLSKALQDRGINIKATDDMSWDKVNVYQWTEVEDLEASEAIKKYKDVDYILASWMPMHIDSMKIIETIRKYNPNVKLIIIGEDCGGCTANDEWFDNIEVYNDELFNQLGIKSEMKSWYGLHDDIDIYEFTKS